MRSRHSSTWPRVYAQLLATGDIIEFARGEYFTPDSYAALVAGFGGAWRTWIEMPMPAAGDGIGRPPEVAA